MTMTVRPAGFGFTSARGGHMRQLPFTASSIFSFLRSAIGALARFLGPSWDGPARYRPEDHYMRGPGPKWREKHFDDRASAGRA